ncbi:MAG TPA: hypothetical protein VK387_06495 [Thermoleophilaceae bacterium]|nr:hypothetical protein [Thermoleophilaceae bacterium]
MKRRRRSPMGGARVSRRWEVGLPLMLLGAMLAGLTVGVRGGGLFFWAGAVLVAIGAAAFFTPPPER